MAWKNCYWDSFICPNCGKVRWIIRNKTSAGKKVQSWCTSCRKQVEVKAGLATRVNSQKEYHTR